MTGGAQQIVVGPGDGRTIEGPVGGPLTFKVRGEQTGGVLTVFENVIPPGQGPPLHSHDNEDEAWYVLAGELDFMLDAEIHRAPAGSFVLVPRGVPHCFVNVAAEPARILVLFTPSGMERFFDGFAGLETLDQDAFRRLGEPVGMTVLGPPLAPPDRR
jgi:quercetin dioxygenase-like cupin family protein